MSIVKRWLYNRILAPDPPHNLRIFAPPNLIVHHYGKALLFSSGEAKHIHKIHAHVCQCLSDKHKSQNIERVLFVPVAPEAQDAPRKFTLLAVLRQLRTRRVATKSDLIEEVVTHSYP